ncbi:hypothetical protein ACFPM0_24465 [Pseudonocardia sulfidoxydans]|uniref:hypothetical protein n=1 Tax=Pseudonocardia sulfidoxydans TaxID=54011 RepID=UPI0036237B19
MSALRRSRDTFDRTCDAHAGREHCYGQRSAERLCRVSLPNSAIVLNLPRSRRRRRTGCPSAAVAYLRRWRPPSCPPSRRPRQPRWWPGRHA